MINITYNHPNIKVDTKEVSKLYHIPLKVEIVTHVSKNIQWDCEIGDNSWATFANDSIFDVVIRDANGKIIINREFNVLEDGSYLDKAFYLYCSTLNNPQGLTIGSHDGEFGEWVCPTLDNLTKTILVEASTPQFTKLTENYKDFSNVDLIQNLVTTDGSKVEFFEGGKGYTNSVKENVIRSWEKEEINSNLRESISINDLINQVSPNKKLDWLHLDIEGYDAEILRAINVDLLPNFIIFEHNNLLMEDKLRLENYLIDLGYYLNRDDSVSYLAIK
jgi:FkbM family methyltransferase